MFIKKIHLLFIFIFVFAYFIPIQVWAQTPPELTTTTLDRPYCPETQIPIVTSFNIVPGDEQIDAVFIQISENYKDTDTLILGNLASHPNVSSSWNAQEGKLTLTPLTPSSIAYIDLIAAVKDVVFESSLANPSIDKSFSITVGEANYLPSTGHYYEYVSNTGITWTEAKFAAESASSKYNGLQGYLATITTPEEAQLSGEQAAGAGWIGGSDETVEGTWRWMTGPEAGKSFWIGEGNGTTFGTDFPYANWNAPDEPNNSGGEHYAHVVHPDLPGANDGEWNDLSNTGDTNTTSLYHPQGYLVEYGGMPGDPVLNISADTKIYIPRITEPIAPAPICGSGSATLSATSNTGFIRWYDALTGGNYLGSGDTYTIPSPISTTTSYYALASADGICETGARTPITVIVNTIPTITNVSPTTTICGAGTATLTATASAGTINWYDALGNLLDTGTSFTPASTVSSNTTYYVDATANNCTTSTRTPVYLNVQYTNPPSATSSQTFCDIENATLADLTITGTSILWYATATGTTKLNNTDLLTDNTSYYASQTENTCESPTRLAMNVRVFETVNALSSSAISPMNICDDAIDGDDTNGIVITDLTTNATTLLNGKNTTDFDLTYFSNTSYSTPISNPTTFTNPISGGQTIYVRMGNKLDNTCFTDTSFELQINPLPNVTAIVELKQCDDDTDGISLFNLTEANELISVNHLNEDITYYLTEGEALDGFVTDQITNFINYPNPTALNSTVFARIETGYGCFRTAQIDLVVGVSQIPPTFVTLEYTVCDDELIDGDKRNGIATFDFSDAEQKIKDLFPAPHNFTVTYYNNEADALAEINPITDINNHRNEGYPNSQDIYVRLDSDVVNACLGLGHHITLNVESLPTANPVTFARQCDDVPTDTELSSEFDTSGLEVDLLLGQPNVFVTYFHADGTPLTDLNGNPINSPFPAFFRTISQTITARVVNNITNTNNNTACDDSTTIEFMVDIAPVVNPIPIAPACDDGVDDTDGFHEFDTTNIESTILGTQTGMVVSYTDGIGADLPSPLPNPFNSNTQTIIVTVENPINTTCVANTTIDFIVNPLPDFDITTPQIVCLNNPTTVLTIDWELDNYTYDWKDGLGSVLITNSTDLPVTIGGLYEVTATNIFGCQRSKTIQVNESITATITEEDITVVDDSENNSITITTTNLGIGDYEFAIQKMDEFTSDFQDEPYFEKLTPGIYTLFIQDKNDCGIAQIDVSVIGFPKFFTPNNDGKNDTWKVLGVNENFYATSAIYIFDRFGKLITQIDPAGEGWDGSFNGKMQSSTDYWFSVQLIDKDGNTREKRGHFSLIRR